MYSVLGSYFCRKIQKEYVNFPIKFQIGYTNFPRRGKQGKKNELEDRREGFYKQFGANDL